MARLSGSAIAALASSMRACCTLPACHAATPSAWARLASPAMKRSSTSRKLLSGSAPWMVWATSPRQKNFTVGTEFTLKRRASSGSSSAFSMTSRNLPPYSAASFTSRGIRMKQGPALGVQKCTSTGPLCEFSSTSRLKFSALASKT